VETSIVAVHGLNTTNTNNHAEAAWTSKDKLWLRDFLPTSLPRARILLFSYNANVAFKTSIAGVREQATDLLNQLDGKRKGSKDRPIIFIAHSLGGIVVKRALVEAKLNGSYKAIGNATYGIAFFGTPHKGGKHVKLGELATATVRGILRGPFNSFLEAMKKDSLFADALEKDFQHLFEDYKILSFYETRPMNKIGLV
jgi:triacylglycerol esterase/lipase EstA (alpha/beta hydrolase family)